MNTKKKPVQIMINKINFNTQNIQNRFQRKIGTMPNAVQKECTEPPFVPAPSIQYISFGEMYSNINYTLQGQIKKLAPEQYPSKRILETAQKIINEDPKTTKTIYDAHNEYYAPLLECQTLDEAKALYPEFQDVIDASTLEITHESPLALKKINRGEIEGVTIQNASLMFLKHYYGKVGSPKKKEDFFGFGPTACHAVFDILNIKKLDKGYVMVYSHSKPENRQAMSSMRKRVAATPECKKNASEAQQRRWDGDEGAERRKRAAETQRMVWANLSEEERQVWRTNQIKAMQTDAFKEKVSKASKQRWSSPEGRERISLGWQKFIEDNPEYREVKSKAWTAHPDIIKVMQDTLEDFPEVRPVISKVHKGEPLTEAEKRAQKQYLAECKRRCPDMYERVNGTFSKMWQEFKKSKESNE